MGIIYSLFAISQCYQCEMCVKLERFLNITGLISNIILIGLLILGITNNKWKNMHIVGIFLFFIYFSLIILTLIIQIISIILKKNFIKKHKILYLIIIIIDILSSIIDSSFQIAFYYLYKGDDVEKQSQFCILIFLFCSFLFGIHCYCFCQLFFNFRIIEKQSIRNIAKTESSTNINNNKNKNFYFKGTNDLNEELLFSEDETVENLLFEYKKKYKSNINIENLYFFFNEKRIDIKEKRTIKTYFEFANFYEEVTINIKIKDKTNIKNLNLMENMSIKKKYLFAFMKL